ncbi:N-acetyltransferase eco [Toxorhynchites rutilus septentrionalis]|uniref:N-acetyltransferase eco n=1 Tax=Toxorhynchites rutilus septentrionalis TaxID=329112 RepID=UPI00247A4057|nr:N-acetyltransferase eco [Toxorhynchites rutilus septentrionalis]
MRKHVSFEVHGDSSSEASTSSRDPQTPRSGNRWNTRSRHVPTPKMTERKKALFGGYCKKSEGIEDVDLGPMSPLKFSNSPKRVPMKSMNITSFRNILGNASPESDRSLSPDFESRFSRSDMYEILPASHNKENLMTDEETRQSFTNGTPKAGTPVGNTLLDETNSNSLSQLMNSDLNIVDRKNHLLKTPGVSNTNGQKKELVISLRKLSFPCTAITPNDDNSPANTSFESKARTSLSFGDMRPISTKSFYSSSNRNNTPKSTTPKKVSPLSVPTLARMPVKRASSSNKKRRQSTKKHTSSIRLGNINRGVFHRIKKPTKAKSLVKKLSTSHILESTISILDKSMEKKNESRSMPATPEEPLLKQQLNRIRRILQGTRNPIEQARPLSLSKSLVDLSNTSLYHDDSSDGESDDGRDGSLANDLLLNAESEASENDDAKSEGGARKFFKSSSSKRIKREYKVVNNVCATVRKGGKIQLNQSKLKKRKYKSMFEEDFDFESEQLEVDDIISKLNQSNDGGGGIVQKIDSQQSSARECQPQPVEIEFIDALRNEVSNDEPIPVQSNIIFVDRLSPLSDSQDNNCMQEVPAGDVCSPNGEYHQSPMTQIRTMTSEMSITKAVNVTDLLSKAGDEGGKLFPIFYRDHQRAVANAETSQDTYVGLFDSAWRQQKRLQTWRPIGPSQMQIDAGQKQYGARQCPECDLVYSVHEPEEELIHENYHNSIHVLRFNGWKNEPAVAHVPEWDVTGRILGIPIVLAMDKHRLRKVQQVLDVVDRELGYVEPCQLTQGSVVYLAVARSMVLGACVVQPLQCANRLLTIEGIEGSIDCCTTETYPVRCGISRIWISPRFRRHGIARTLLTVIKSHFIFGKQMSYDEIAFSAPTEAGKRLAESVTGRKDFLIYM